MVPPPTGLVPVRKPWVKPSFPRFDDQVQETIFRNPKLQEEGLDSEAPQRPTRKHLGIASMCYNDSELKTT